jgi:serine/threonine protein kinase
MLSNVFPPPLAPVTNTRRPLLHLTSPGVAARASLALALSQNSGPMSNAFNVKRNLRPDEQLNMGGIGGRSVYYIRSEEDGAITGIRKVATAADLRPGQFQATRREAAFYNTIRTVADWAEHIVPVRNVVITPSYVIIDFVYLEGATLDEYTLMYPRESRRILDHVTRGLRWLVMNGYIHGDIRADNFYVTGPTHALMLDFGKTVPILSRLQVRNELMAFANLIRPYYATLASWIDAHTIVPVDQTPQAYLTHIYTIASRRLRRQEKTRRRRTRGTHKNIPRMV